MRRLRHPVELFLDVFVYAPIGFLVEAPRLIPELVETGRRQLATARGVGRLAFQLGSQRVTSRPSSSSQPATAARVGPDETSSVSAVDEPTDALPIPGYDQLAASQVAARLDDLDADGLRAVEEYERAHRQRRTVLAKVAQLRRP